MICRYIVRFDDRLATILRQPTDNGGAISAVWSQLVDLLAQSSNDSDNAVATQRLRTLRDTVPVQRRIFTSQAIAQRIANPMIVRAFGQDTAAVAAPLLARVQLAEDDWLKIIPDLPPTSRALLRERRDLPDSAVRALQSFGLGDFALPTTDIAAPVPAPAPAAAPTQISELVARIEAFKQERGAAAPHVFMPPLADDDVAPSVASFRFESDRSGLLCWIEGAGRGALIGISLADLAEPRSFGVDGLAAGAFRKRTAFKDARLIVPGSGPESGDWRISGDPMFDPSQGRFLGYRGIARRPEAINRLTSDPPALLGKGVSPDSVRQLVHELRTPLNAIRGFAEMIENQLLGPVAQPYRARAHNIVGSANQLAAIVDDLDIAARLQSQTEPDESGSFELGAALNEIIAQLAPQCELRDIAVIAPPKDCDAVVPISRKNGDRLIRRIVNMVIGLGEAGEKFMFAINCQPDVTRLSVARPRILIGQDSVDFEDFRVTTETQKFDAPALGLAFTIRLIRQMARSVGGQFNIDSENFALILPSVRDSAGETKESG
jgi:His Kinase A (phospho-acceptor) domain